MFPIKGMFSEAYNEQLKRRDLVRGLTLNAIRKIDEEKTTLYGTRVDTRNPEEVIAVLFLMQQDAMTFRETV